MAETDNKDLITPVYDWELGDFKTDPQGRVVMAAREEAVIQIVLKALQTARSRYYIYFDLEDPDQHDKYGSEAQAVLTSADLDEAARIDELKRAITEALIYHEWIDDVYDVVISRDPKEVGLENHPKEIDGVYANFRLRTVFDNEIFIQGVNLNNG
jgi:hypothetical protein